MGRKTIEFRSVFPGTAQELWDFHAQPKAFNKLTPPPIFIQVLDNRLKSLTDGTVEFRMWLGPVPLHWRVQHKPGPTACSFVDQLVSGPMAYWEHHHLFTDVEGGAELLDRLTIDHKPGLMGIFTRLMFDGLPLRIFFLYRHLRTRWGIKR